jgi:hypothetical protein
MCGLEHSTLVSTPDSLMGLVVSNSAVYESATLAIPAFAQASSVSRLDPELPTRRSCRCPPGAARRGERKRLDRSTSNPQGESDVPRHGVPGTRIARRRGWRAMSGAAAELLALSRQAVRESEWKGERRLRTRSAQLVRGGARSRLEGFSTCIADPALEQSVEADTQRAYMIRIKETPTLAVNGKPVPAVMNWVIVAAAIETALNESSGSAAGRRSELVPLFAARQ